MMRVKQIEPAQVEMRAKDEVRASFIVFAVLCAAIRITPFLLRKLSSS
ncbi:uncharacterized protein LOC26527146 [Drosophila mojavensis]|uniref:Mitochondrial import receptor subunit TOM5 homolog n=1 Tax=Drosophila mojavensis TaxID=7230 RepID=A0A0Q9XE53_DROMO|nr:uncharacterized protein LOC26527146 [Drosophila mojavensis]KRG03268.1 uncharacterized protein Dmoj_GI25505 [Drosophila mojavensis]